MSQLFPGTGKVICIDAFKYCQKSNLNFDLIFADPPFNHKDIETIPSLIFNNLSLNKNALIVLEHPNDINLSEHSNYTETRKYGNISFSFFQKNK